MHEGKIEDILDFPTLHKAAHAFPVRGLGSKESAGALAVSLASYMGELKDRLLDGDEIKRNLFIQFGYSQLPMSGFQSANTLHAGGGTNVPLMLVVAHDTDVLVKLAISIETAVRDNAAKLSEHSDNAIQSVIVVIDETDEEKEPSSAFGVPENLIDPDFHMETKVSVPSS